MHGGSLPYPYIINNVKNNTAKYKIKMENTNKKQDQIKDGFVLQNSHPKGTKRERKDPSIKQSV